MTRNASNAPSLEEQLRSEERTCPTCGYTVANPLYERCPRCYGVLPKLELFCQGCLHRSLCPAVASAEGEGKKMTGARMREDLHRS